MDENHTKVETKVSKTLLSYPDKRYIVIMFSNRMILFLYESKGTDAIAKGNLTIAFFFFAFFLPFFFLIFLSRNHRTFITFSSENLILTEHSVWNCNIHQFRPQFIQ